MRGASSAAAFAVLLMLAGCAGPALPTTSSTSAPATVPPVPEKLAPPLFGANVLLGAPNIAGIAGEPSVTSAPDGTLYVSAPVIPADAIAGTQAAGQGRVWRSTDGGATFKLLNDANGWLETSKKQSGDGDTDIAVDATGRVHFVDLGAGIPYLTSDDRGDHWTDRGSLSQPSTNVDRQWVATDNQTVAVTWNDFGQGRGGATVVVSADGGATWGKALVVTKDNAWEGPVVVAPGGRDLYIPFLAASTGNLFVAASHDGGATWSATDTGHLAAKPPQANPGITTGTSAQTYLFPVLTVDDAGDLYLVWSQYTGTPTATTDVEWMRSTDQGATWKDMGSVSTGHANAVFPWAVAGAAGRFAVTFLVSDLPLDPSYGPHQWHLEARVTQDALADKPTFAAAFVTPGVVHTGAICPNGGGCGAIVDPAYGDRTLLDFLECGATPDGHVIVAWTETHEQNGRDPEIHFAVQGNGTFLR